MIQDTQAERERFEAHFTDTWGAFYVARKENGEYWDELNEARWQGWQAARKSVADRPEQPVAPSELNLPDRLDWYADRLPIMRSDLYAAATHVRKSPAYAAPVARPEQTCPRCKGSGEGPLAYPADQDGTLETTQCIKCGGTGAVDRPEPAQPVAHEPAPTWWINQVIGDYAITGAQAEALWASVLKEANRG